MSELDRAIRTITKQRLAGTGHFDADDTIFLERELTQLRQRTYTVLFPELIARSMAPKATDIAASADTYSFKVYTPTGAAELIGYKTGKIPRVDLKANEVYGKVRPIAAAYGWDINELRESARVGLPLSAVKGRIAADAMERGIDELLAFGSLEDSGGNRMNIGLNGMVNNSLVDDAILSGAYWVAGMDPDDMLADLNALAIAVSNQSYNVFQSNAIILPLSHYNLASQTPWSALTGDTVLTVFKKNNPQITSVTPWWRLNSVATAVGGDAGKARAITYFKDPMVLESVIPQEMEQFPPELKGLDFVINCHARCGGVKVYQPLGMKYMDFAAS